MFLTEVFSDDSFVNFSQANGFFGRTFLYGYELSLSFPLQTLIIFPMNGHWWWWSLFSMGDNSQVRNNKRHFKRFSLHISVFRILTHQKNYKPHSMLYNKLGLVSIILMVGALVKNRSIYFATDEFLSTCGVKDMYNINNKRWR